ncbi:hypothetical protein Micbo1qcDRAFT_164156 [Microdochium bolleyi]|uniref:Uncharacterized protein n=1 Tax=Microdochium bolleyi TaxID=196109 RepID=A0A136J043_9PEZI|nr:hypothetical protein Micbo1qcDRAFT_164156 [Microdochium bolleyi]
MANNHFSVPASTHGHAGISLRRRESSELCLVAMDSELRWYCCGCGWTHTYDLHPACINCDHHMCQACRWV